MNELQRLNELQHTDSTWMIHSDARTASDYLGVEGTQVLQNDSWQVQAYLLILPESWNLGVAPDQINKQTNFISTPTTFRLH